MILFYVRHGDPIYNPDSLTELGQKQAEALCERFKIKGLDKIYASSSNRAILTATPTANMLNKEIEILDWCNEGYVWQEFVKTREDGFVTWLFNYPEVVKLFVSKEMYDMGMDWINHPAFSDTKVKDGTKRINENADALLLSLGFRHDREQGLYYVENKNTDRVALFAHEGFGMAFLSSILDIPYPLFSTRFGMSHSTVTVIHFDETKDVCIPKVLTYANDSHILKSNLPLKFNNNLDI